MKNTKANKYNLIAFVAVLVSFISFFTLPDTAVGQNANNTQSEEESWWNRFFGGNDTNQNQDNYTFQNETLRRLDEDEKFRNDLVNRLRNDRDFRHQFLQGISQAGIMGRIFADSFENDPQWRNNLLDEFQNDAAFRHTYLRRIDQWSKNMMNENNMAEELNGQLLLKKF